MPDTDDNDRWRSLLTLDVNEVRRECRSMALGLRLLLPQLNDLAVGVAQDETALRGAIERVKPPLLDATARLERIASGSWNAGGEA